MAEKKGRGRSYECRACDAGFSDGRCIMKGVVYSMDCACTRVGLGGSSTFTGVRTPTTHSEVTFLLAFTAMTSSGRARKRVTSVSTSVATGADGGRCA